MACKGCAKRREAIAASVSKVYARAQVLRQRVQAKRAREKSNAK